MKTLIFTAAAVAFITLVGFTVLVVAPALTAAFATFPVLADTTDRDALKDQYCDLVFNIGKRVAGMRDMGMSEGVVRGVAMQAVHGDDSQMVRAILTETVSATYSLDLDPETNGHFARDLCMTMR